MTRDELLFMQRYESWLFGGRKVEGEERKKFFTQSLIVLDTNVLLSLYEYTPDARSQVLEALRSVQAQLWLPHQVGLEFVRRRIEVMRTRTSTLKAGKREVDQRLNKAVEAVVEAVEHVQGMLRRYARDDQAAEEIAASINRTSIESLLGNVRSELKSRVEILRQSHDFNEQRDPDSDMVLRQVAELYGEHIGEQPAADELRRRVEEASQYRFPNEIPPGFADASKNTALQAAGDYLMWEEIIAKASESGSPGRVLFVSADAKRDWYEPASSGQDARPWPFLADELRLRSRASLRIETPAEFYEGLGAFLEVQIASTTYEEIEDAVSTVEVSTAMQELTHLVGELGERMDAGDDSDETLDAYLRAKKRLAEVMQQLLIRDLDTDSTLENLRNQLEDALHARYGGVIPDDCLRAPRVSRVHEHLFAMLHRSLGEPVEVARLRLAAGDSRFAERRVRELSELGLFIEAAEKGGLAAYKLLNLDLDLDVLESIVKRNLRSAVRSGRISSDEYRELVRKLGRK